MRFALIPIAAVLLAHPLHTTHTDLVESDAGVTVHIRTFTDDLRSAVGKRERAVDDSALAHYLRETVTLSDSSGRSLPLSFVGQELQGEITILRLRAPATHLASARFSQLMHMELFSDQVNVVQVSYSGRKVSLLFVPGDTPKRLP